MSSKKTRWTVADIPDMHGKVVIVTVGNSGLGYESVKALAEKGARVVLASRTVEKGEQAKAAMSSSDTTGEIDVIELDLMDFASIKSFADTFKSTYDRLDVLMNNAGIMTTPYFLTRDGLEAQNGTNHFGHFLLTGLLMDLIEQTPGARIVNVSSNAHKYGKMDFDNLLFENGREYTPMRSYGRSKLANLLFTYELDRRLKSRGIQASSLAAHPGASRTNLSRYMEEKWWFKPLWALFYGMTQSQAMGALPQIRAAVDPEAQGGEYYGPGGLNEMKGYPVPVQSNGTSHSKEDAIKLWQASEQTTGINYL